MVINRDILRKETVAVFKAIDEELGKAPLSTEATASLLCAKSQAIHTLVLLQQR